MDGLLHLIAELLPEEHRDLSRWLVDKGSRPAPFIDFDLRGLSAVHQSAFYAAARKALDELSHKHPPAVGKGHAAEALDRLLQLKASIHRGEPPSSLSDDDKPRPYDGQPIDLSDLWSLATNGGSAQPDPCAQMPNSSGLSLAARSVILVFVGLGTAAGVCAGWYFGQSDASPLTLVCIIAAAAVLTCGLTAGVLFLWSGA